MEVVSRKLWGQVGTFSTHKSKWNVREDHALVACEWKWRLRQVDVPSRLPGLFKTDLRSGGFG